jgi:hypothetical protein
MKWLIALGLVITLLGAGFGFWGLWVTEDQALEIGQARLSGDNREHDLQLPSVQNLIRQSRFCFPKAVPSLLKARLSPRNRRNLANVG